LKDNNKIIRPSQTQQCCILLVLPMRCKYKVRKNVALWRVADDFDYDTKSW